MGEKWNAGFFVGDGWDVCDAETGRVVAKVFDDEWHKDRARLIAAAPDLLAALEECAAWFADRADTKDGAGECDPPGPNAEMSMQQMCDAAIAEATKS